MLKWDTNNREMATIAPKFYDHSQHLTVQSVLNHQENVPSLNNCHSKATERTLVCLLKTLLSMAQMLWQTMRIENVTYRSIRMPATRQLYSPHAYWVLTVGGVEPVFELSTTDSCAKPISDLSSATSFAGQPEFWNASQLIFQMVN